MQFANVERNACDLQQALTPDEIGRVCHAAFGAQATPVAVWRMTSGRFNTVYRLEFADRAPVILRVAPPPAAQLFRHEARLMRRECAVQPLLAAALGAVIPQVLHIDFSRQVLPRDYVFLNCLDGELWEDVRAGLSADEEQSLWAQFGDLVRRIHAIPNAAGYGYPQLAAPDDFPAYARHSDWFIAHVADLCADIAELAMPVAALDEYRRLLDIARPLIDAAGPPRLVHGDLWLRNVLVTRGAEGAGDVRISGILDAERAFWGEAGAEWIFSFFDLPEAFWNAYGTDLRDAALAGDKAAQFRRRAYQARGALQLLLESQRFGFDAAFARRNFAQAVAAMEVLPLSG